MIVDPFSTSYYAPITSYECIDFVAVIHVVVVVVVARHPRTGTVPYVVLCQHVFGNAGMTSAHVSFVTCRLRSGIRTLAEIVGHFKDSDHSHHLFIPPHEKMVNR
jgi:hypothetical protein